MARHGIGLGAGVALYVGAVLGPGVLALPALAARTAGPASIVSWAALLALSVPVATAFAALGARYPDGGGIASFVARAFGHRAAAAVGWWFYFAVPVGVVAGALIGGQYVAAALGAGNGTALAVALALLAAAAGANLVGLRLSGAVQLCLVGLLVVLLLAAVAVAAPGATAGNLTPFAPHGAGSVVAGTGVLFFGFVGWEAGSHLSAEFRDPRRHLPRVTGLTLGIVSALYLSLAGTTVAVLGTAAAHTPVPLTLLLARGIGAAAGPVTALAAVLLSFGALNTYLASAARLGAALARTGALPRQLASSGAEPRRSLTVLSVLAGAVTAAVAVWHVPLGTLLAATSACLAAVTAAGLAAAVRLLRPRAFARCATLVAAAAVITVLATTGPLLLLPAVLGSVGALTWRRPGPAPATVRRSSSRGPAVDDAPATSCRGT